MGGVTLLAAVVVYVRLVMGGFCFVTHSPESVVLDCVRLTPSDSVCLTTPNTTKRIEIDQPCGPPIVAVLHWNADGMMQTRLIERANPCVFRFPIVYGGYR